MCLRKYEASVTIDTRCFLSKFNVLCMNNVGIIGLFFFHCDFRMCLNDGKVARRLLRRRVGLMNKLSEKLSSPNGGIAFDRRSSVPAGDPPHLAEPKQPVWVDGEVLRRFLSCDKTENSFAVPASGPLLRHKHLLCEHGNGLHPRVARRGKLLPRPLYDVLVSLMLGEQCMINGEDHQVAVSLFDEDIVNDCIITPEQNMYCENVRQFIQS